ncbi:MAG: thiamine pyrophosphate-dependent enzyme [Steroidobacteraceae bacterium]
MKMTGGQALVAQLMREGVRHVFGIPGVQLDWAVEALRQHRDEIAFIVPRHEQAASYMADGYARSTGREGVSMVVPGPGVLNALSGLATAYACSSRTLFIAGQVPSPMLGRHYGMLHEIRGQSEILEKLTKWHAIALRTQEIAEIVHEAFHQLRSGLARPVAIEIPPDVLQQATDAALLARAPVRTEMPTDEAVQNALELLRTARFPVIQVGGGAAAAESSEPLAQLAERLQAPVVMTEGARGLLPSRHPLALTGLGGRAVFPHADVILAVGTRFLDAQAKPVHDDPTCRYVYVNLDRDHTGAPRRPGIAVIADARATLERLAAALADMPPRPSRAESVAAVKAWCAVQLCAIQPQSAYVEAIRRAAREDVIVVSELTQVGYFANVAFPVNGPRTYLTPGYQGTLGYGLPTALGAAVGNPARRVISINGDGGFGWNMQELLTAVRYGLHVTVLVFADGRYGNVRRIQRRVFGEEFATEVANPDFAKLAAAFGVAFRSIDSPAALHDVLSASAGESGPMLIEVKVGEMASPWSVIHPFVPAPIPPPPNPLGSPPQRREPPPHS